MPPLPRWLGCRARQCARVSCASRPNSRRPATAAARLAERARCRIPQSALGSSLRPFQVAAGVRVAKFQYEQASASLPECSMLMRHDAVRPGEAAVNGAASKPLIALTGATGFIGKFLLRELPKLGYRLRVLLRRPSAL